MILKRINSDLIIKWLFLYSNRHFRLFLVILAVGHLYNYIIKPAIFKYSDFIYLILLST